MKKTLLSVLAAVSVIGAASAVPSAEDRKAMCDKNPDKYVWVEKNQACVPVNPCTSSNESMKKAYCLLEWISSDNSLSTVRQVADKYATQVLKTSVSEIKFFNRDKDPQAASVKTSDGGYFAMSFVSHYGSDLSPQAYDYLNSLKAYGYDSRDIPIVDEAKCRDIADFASLLYGDLIEFRTQEDVVNDGSNTSLHYVAQNANNWNKVIVYINHNPKTNECLFVIEVPNKEY